MGYLQLVGMVLSSAEDIICNSIFSASDVALIIALSAQWPSLDTKVI